MNVCERLGGASALMCAVMRVTLGGVRGSVIVCMLPSRAVFARLAGLGAVDVARDVARRVAPQLTKSAHVGRVLRSMV